MKKNINKTTKKCLIAGVTVLTMLMVSACGSDDGENNTTGQTDTTAAVSENQSANTVLPEATNSTVNDKQTENNNETSKSGANDDSKNDNDSNVKDDSNDDNSNVNDVSSGRNSNNNNIVDDIERGVKDIGDDVSDMMDGNDK